MRGGRGGPPWPRPPQAYPRSFVPSRRSRLPGGLRRAIPVGGVGPAGPAVAAARRHRPVALGQDRVHHGAGAPSRRGHRRCPHSAPRPRAASAAPAWRTSRTTTCPASPSRSISSAIVAERRWPRSTTTHQRAAGRHRVRARGRLALRPRDARPRHRRLPGRVAPRPRAPRRRLRRVVAPHRRRRAAGRTGRRSPRPGTRACASTRPDRRTSSSPLGRAEAFKAYLAALRAGPEAVATTPPGRFLMPGDLAGSPALTFAPLDLAPGAADRAQEPRRR